jgi:hypothetical protein
VRLRKRSEPESAVTESLEPLNEAELEWVSAHVATATEMLDGDPTPERLDGLWSELLGEQPEDPNLATNLVGLALGQLLAERLALSWVALTDGHGTEIAVRGRANFTVFPTNFIAKRYAARETNFLASAFGEMVKTAESLG